MTIPGTNIQSPDLSLAMPAGGALITIPLAGKRREGNRANTMFGGTDNQAR